jgi:hypothetical protein
MVKNSDGTLNNVNGVASFIVQVPGVQKPRITRRVSDLRRQVIMIGRVDDPAALADLRDATPDLALSLPRPVLHLYETEQPDEVVLVVGPGDVLATKKIVDSYAARPLNRVMARGPRFVLALNMLYELHVVTGMPGSGRRDYIAQRVRRMESLAGPGQMTIIKTSTTRKPRAVTDSLYYDFMSQEEFRLRCANGDMLQVTSYGNVSYGLSRQHVLEALDQSDGICVLIEPRVDELMTLGFPVFITEMSTSEATLPPSKPNEGSGGPTIH